MPSSQEITTKIQGLKTRFAERLADHASNDELTTLSTRIKSLKNQSNIAGHSQLTSLRGNDYIFQTIKTTGK